MNAFFGNVANRLRSAQRKEEEEESDSDDVKDITEEKMVTLTFLLAMLK